MDWPIIHSYSRAQAIADGVLVDLTAWAAETGFMCPVAITQEAWATTIHVGDEAKAFGQDERGRAHDVLWMLYVAARRGRSGTSELSYQVLVQDGPNRSGTVDLKSVAGPGDNGELVLTIMMPHED